NKSASVTLPVGPPAWPKLPACLRDPPLRRGEGPSKTYSFSILTQGKLRRWRFNASRSFENFFSFTRSFLRATSHSFCDTTLRFSIPPTVLIFGMKFPFLLNRFRW